MKKAIYISLVVIVSLISFSCEDSFEPKAPFSEKYVLNCVINSDSLMQTASLSRTYDVEGFDPYTNDIDPYIKNALVYIKYKGVTYQMRDTAITRTDTSRYKGPLNIYTLTSFVPFANDSVEVIAIPKDGVLLKAKTKVPSKVDVIVSRGSILEPRTEITFSWNARDKDIYYLPRLKIIYTLRNEIPNKLYYKEVPIYIDNKGEKRYPQITKVTSVYFGPEMLDEAMLEISENGEMSNYKFIRLELEVKLFDEFLSSYISSTNVFYDDVSIRLDEPNFTNIEGGLGIVGSSNKVYKTVGLTADYIQSLGYTK